MSKLPPVISGLKEDELKGRRSSDVIISKFKKEKKNKKKKNKNKKKKGQIDTKPTIGVTSKKGVEVPGFQVGSILGKGASGSVYKGLNVKSGKFFAIKQVEIGSIEDEEELEEILFELELMQSLSHTNITKLHDYIYDTNINYLHLVMELVEGGSLSDVVNKFGCLPEPLIALYVYQVLEGLKYLHSEDVVHRDLKAANLLITKDGTVKLADFGASARIEEKTSKRNSVVGTPYWMAPECILMEGSSKASDVWALGATALELLTNAPPFFHLDSMAALFQIVECKEIPLPKNASDEMLNFLKSCFKKDPSERLTVNELIEHEWIKLHCNQNKSLDYETLTKTVKEFNTRRDTMKNTHRGLSEFMAQTTEEINALSTQLTKVHENLKSLYSISGDLKHLGDIMVNNPSGLKRLSRQISINNRKIEVERENEHRILSQLHALDERKDTNSMKFVNEVEYLDEEVESESDSDSAANTPRSESNDSINSPQAKPPPVPRRNTKGLELSKVPSLSELEALKDSSDNVVKAVALVDSTADDETEISFKKGDIILVEDWSDNVWWQGRVFDEDEVLESDSDRLLEVMELGLFEASKVQIIAKESNDQEAVKKELENVKEELKSTKAALKKHTDTHEPHLPISSFNELAELEQERLEHWSTVKQVGISLKELSNHLGNITESLDKLAKDNTLSIPHRRAVHELAIHLGNIVESSDDANKARIQSPSIRARSVSNTFVDSIKPLQEKINALKEETETKKLGGKMGKPSVIRRSPADAGRVNSRRVTSSSMKALAASARAARMRASSLDSAPKGNMATPDVPPPVHTRKAIPTQKMKKPNFNKKTKVAATVSTSLDYSGIADICENFMEKLDSTALNKVNVVHRSVVGFTSLIKRSDQLLIKVQKEVSSQFNPYLNSDLSEDKKRVLKLFSHLIQQNATLRQQQNELFLHVQEETLRKQKEFEEEFNNP